MKNFPLIASKLYCDVWHIRAADHVEICRQFLAHCRGDDPVGPKWSDGEPVCKQVELAGNVAVLPIHGIIGKHLSALEMWCGGVDLNVVCQQAKNIAEDPFAKACVVDLRTPGGVGIGLPEAADTLRDISRAGKRLIAWVDYQCCSAGYWLAAACDEIWAAPSAIVGSIGTYIAALDSSRAWEMEGLELKLFRDGAVKGVGHPGKRWTAEEEAYMQGLVETHGRAFKDWIRERRKLGEESMQGQWWPAQDAPTGMVNVLARDFDEVLAELVL